MTKPPAYYRRNRASKANEPTVFALGAKVASFRKAVLLPTYYEKVAVTTGTQSTGAVSAFYPPNLLLLFTLLLSEAEFARLPPQNI
jgi:hypothetical protein